MTWFYLRHEFVKSCVQKVRSHCLVKFESQQASGMKVPGAL